MLLKTFLCAYSARVPGESEAHKRVTGCDAADGRELLSDSLQCFIEDSSENSESN